MNKNKTIMAGIGGGALVAAGVIGYLIFSAQGQKTDIADEFEGLIGTAATAARFPRRRSPSRRSRRTPRR